MEIDQQQIDALAANPTESLSVEVKRWIDPNTVPGQAKIIKAALALRNRNGGFLVVGFDDNGAPDVANQLADPRAGFHIDVIQGLVSRYTQEFFEVGVGFSTREGFEYPIIVVPAGVQTPVAAKRVLDGPNNRLINLGDVYFRTLAANGTPSTSVARPEDWREIIGICFDNREADVGRFLRRQLAGQDPAALASVLWGITASAPAVSVGSTLEERAKRLFDDE
ncbi:MULTISPECIES: AlbA family DNA-binding domain-containing protein [unclassified Mesorhizobium]|uniref:AlbA family DNA-binding domain-containing protein n=1 Tax=unclassified Mesorhizobium TaxID=325217 RepID=UPI0030142B84